MHRSLSSRSSVRRLLETGFTAGDVGEALVSFDGDAAAATAWTVMEREDFDVVGVRDEGVVVGFLHRDDLGDGTCAEVVRYFGTDHLVDLGTPLRAVITMLNAHPRVFVRILGDVGGIVTRHDLEKPAVRTWLFGLVTIAEQAFGELIVARWPDEGWRDVLSEGRLALAARLLAERERRGDAVPLLECLHFADKARIVFSDAELRDGLGIESSKRGREVIRNLERLRNGLAHSQSLMDGSGDTVFRLAARLDDILDRLDRQLDRAGG